MHLFPPEGTEEKGGRHLLEKVNLEEKLSKEVYRAEIERLKRALTALDAPLRAAGLPVIILFEGWSSAGKGLMIQKLIQNFDPRWFTVVNTQPPTETELRYPMLWRHWQTIPEEGQLSIMDRSWYQEVSTLRLKNGIPEEKNRAHMDDILRFERTLTDNGYLILKFFLHLPKEEMERRLTKLAENPDTSWRVSKADWKRVHHYRRYQKCYDLMLEYTNSASAPWHIFSGVDRRAATVGIFRALLSSVQEKLARLPGERAARKISAEHIDAGDYRFIPMPALSETDLSVKLDEAEYRASLKREQKRLSENHNRLYLHRIPLLIAYEGWDAAGKGGNIKRLSAALDPRGYIVHPIASPSPEEKKRHFLWRFWKRLPKDGHIAIFDRSWYGRVLVERIEGFCETADWQRAYREINDFECGLWQWGAVIVKFWIHISNEEQLRRFEARERIPEKQWKITDEDWRNREKWPGYESAVDEMLRYTSTDFAPWHILSGNDKYYARVQALRAVNEAIEKRLG